MIDIALDIIILVMLLGYIILLNKRVLELKAELLQKESKTQENLSAVMESKAAIISKRIEESLSTISNLCINSYEKYLQDFEAFKKNQEEQGNNLKLSVINNLDTLLIQLEKCINDSLNVYSKESVLQLMKTLSSRDKEIAQIKGKCTSIEDNIQIMEEIFRLQLVNSMVDDAEDAIRIYKNNVAKKRGK